MSEVHPEFGKPMTEAEYAKEWEDNSSDFERRGFYTMPLERLGAPKTVLEIGCGAGRSTLALAKGGHKVIAYEINEVAVEKTREYLSLNGIENQVVRSFPSAPQDLPCVTLVLGDINAQDFSKLQEAERLGAVLCWFIGAQPDVIADSLRKPSLQLVTEDVRNYRLAIQSKCYEIGRHLLETGGMVQIVDRLALRSWQDKDPAREELAQMQRAISGPDYEISKSSTYLYKISGEFEASGIQYLTENSEARVNVVTSVVGQLVGREG